MLTMSGSRAASADVTVPLDDPAKELQQGRHQSRELGSPRKDLRDDGILTHLKRQTTDVWSRSTERAIRWLEPGSAGSWR
jgi:hypothetical protein